MKFLAGLVHAAAASQVVFDNLDPLDTGATGTPISKDQGVAVQFRSLPAADTACNPTWLTLDFVNFTLNTINMGGNTSLWLQADLCPSVDGLPNCTKSDKPARIPIDKFAKRVKFQWFPASPIVLIPSTTYWFTVLSNGEVKNKLPIWMDGAKQFNTVNDPKKDVLLAYTATQGGPWTVDVPRENRTVSSLQVYAN
ncbi:hypothetical protein DYB32_009636 [Aphanomyces invadans]|nr:hypothetical protein DYB32_009636 [Aphanomyces invadans]